MSDDTNDNVTGWEKEIIRWGTTGAGIAGIVTGVSALGVAVTFLATWLLPYGWKTPPGLLVLAMIGAAVFHVWRRPILANPAPFFILSLLALASLIACMISAPRIHDSTNWYWYFSLWSACLTVSVLMGGYSLLSIIREARGNITNIANLHDRHLTSTTEHVRLVSDSFKSVEAQIEKNRKEAVEAVAECLRKHEFHTAYAHELANRLLALGSQCEALSQRLAKVELQRVGRTQSIDAAGTISEDDMLERIDLADLNDLRVMLTDARYHPFRALIKDELQRRIGRAHSS